MEREAEVERVCKTMPVRIWLRYAFIVIFKQSTIYYIHRHGGYTGIRAHRGTTNMFVPWVGMIRSM